MDVISRPIKRFVIRGLFNQIQPASLVIEHGILTNRSNALRVKWETEFVSTCEAGSQHLHGGAD